MEAAVAGGEEAAAGPERGSLAGSRQGRLRESNTALAVEGIGSAVVERGAVGHGLGEMPGEGAVWGRGRMIRPEAGLNCMGPVA